MKKVLLLVMIIPVLFFSCKKNNQNVSPVNTAQRKYQVHYNLSGFTQQIVASSLNTPKVASLNDAAATTGEQLVLHYFVYDSTGKLVRNLAESSDSTSFKTITDSLAAGTYSVYFIAGGSDIFLQTGGKTMTYPYPSTSGGTGPGWEDTFVKALTLTVQGGNIEQNVTLDRIVTELEVNITDPIPAQAQRLELQVDNEYVYGNFDGSIQTANVSYRYADFQTSATTKKFDLILFNTISPFNVTINAYDAANNIIGHAVVANVKCAKNTRTVLTGGLFGNSTDNFVVSLGDVWNPNPYLTINF